LFFPRGGQPVRNGERPRLPRSAANRTTRELCGRGLGAPPAALINLETDKAVDAKHVGIEGVSRFDKAALVTMAFDTRFAFVLVGSSGEGGAK
jgi:hypothetical protein